ncbi:MAG TPA: HAMP domain-containing sensor histidine kinase [Candidatus Atribacteria bacterium]|nr:HAMP domain-containing sensor histidine kinase [Candidatus Atribacteria bacterium]HPT79273.1 HAMP domain-containing sensor histidine kinase [Candidatus Atribacteria bacterium]
MDIRLKSYKQVLAWLCSILGIFLIIVSSVTLIGYFRDNAYSLYDVNEIFTVDLKERKAFKETLTDLFELLLDAHYSNSSNIILLKAEGDNLLYYSYYPKTGALYTNMSYEPTFPKTGTEMPRGYDYCLYFNGRSFLAQNRDKLVDVYDSTEGYEYRLLKYDSRLYEEDEHNRAESIRIMLLVKEDIDSGIEDSRLAELKRKEHEVKTVVQNCIASAILGILLLATAIGTHRRVAAFNKRIVSIVSKINLEAKLLTLLALTALFDLVNRSGSPRGAKAAVCILPVWWACYLLADLARNKGGFFVNSYAYIQASRLQNYWVKQPLSKALAMKVSLFALTEALLAGAGLFLYILITGAGDQALSSSVTLYVLLAAITAAFFYAAWQGLDRCIRFINGLTRITKQLELVKNGDFETKLKLDRDTILYPVAENLNCIQDGMNKTLQEMLKSERTKVELITNVSHDLKTPLTSIISYIDLLDKETGLPDHVRDYINVLKTKSDRLNRLIQDLFDLSKATSGEIKLDIKTLDLGRLVEQVMADTSDSIRASSLDFRVSTPERTVYISGDSNKLYRILMNLLHNALKFTMPGTRVYVDVTDDNEWGIVEIKNIANYEMDFNENDILERFVKGDKSRSTEGSGLGLAIAKSFAEAGGGSLRVEVDGDLFKAILAIPKAALIVPRKSDESYAMDQVATALALE